MNGESSRVIREELLQNPLINYHYSVRSTNLAFCMDLTTPQLCISEFSNLSLSYPVCKQMRTYHTVPNAYFVRKKGANGGTVPGVRLKALLSK